MTLSRWLLGLTLILSIALPPLDAGAMFRNEAGRAVSNDNDDDDIPPPPDDDVAIEDDPIRAAQFAPIQRRLEAATQVRRRAAIRASVALMLLDAEDVERPAVVARLRQSRDDYDILADEDLDEIEAAVAASLAAPAVAVESSSSSSSSTAAAKAASEAAAPARAVVSLKGKPTRVPAAARDPLSRGLPPPEIRRGAPSGPLPASLDPPDLGAREVRQSHALLAELLSQNIRIFERSNDNPHLRDVRNALKAANALLPSLRQDPVGWMPPDLAEALVSAADREGRLANATGRQPNRFVHNLADPVTGIKVDQLESGERTAPMERVAALDALIAAATAAAHAEVPGTPLQRSLEAVSREALDDRTRLVAYLEETARNFPRAFATVRLPADQLGPPVSGGLNSAPRPVRYDFTNRIVRRTGPATALFKPMEVPTIEKPLIDGQLSATGVVEFPEVPSRLEQRSVATRRVAELLGIGDLVVKMEFAQLDDPAQTFGLLMSRAPGEPGIVERNDDLPEGSAYIDYLDVTNRLAEVQAMVNFLDGKAGGNRPQTPLIAAANPASGAWDRAAWFAQGKVLKDSLLDIPVRDIGPPGAPKLVGVFQERPVTDKQLENPDLRRQLSNAQWLDLLCGQVDRHMGNLFLDASGQVPVVTLIDNDLSFGIKNDIYGLDDPASTPDFRLPPKPFTVDATFKAAFIGLNKTRLREATRGLLTNAEQEALVERFEMLKAYMKSRSVKEVHRPGIRGKQGEPRWDADAAILFRGYGNRNPNPVKGDEYSYYSILAALPQRPRKSAPSPGGN